MAATMTATAADGQLLTEAVHQRLCEEIFDGRLPPGTPLSVPAISARLVVSRTPVRESVQQLIHEGLAVYVPRAGAKVAVVDASTMRSLLEVREMLDGLAAAQAVRHVTPADVVELTAVLDRQEELLAVPPEKRRDADLDLLFHDRIRMLSGNAPLERTLRVLHAQGYLYPTPAPGPAERRCTVAEHRQILDALAVGDASAAEASARAHVGALRIRLLRRAGD